MSDINKQMDKEIKQLEINIGLPTGYYSKLLSEDDWSFIIKLSALFEAVATEALSIKFGDFKINETVSYLEYSNQKSGKIVFLEKLNVITKEQFDFLKIPGTVYLIIMKQKNTIKKYKSRNTKRENKNG